MPPLTAARLRPGSAPPTSGTSWSSPPCGTSSRPGAWCPRRCRSIRRGTTADHGVAARPRRSIVTRGGGSTVLGGGGLLQDETSTFNLDLHLMPVLAARVRREPVVGVGLGAGPLSTRSGRFRVRHALAGIPLAVRDAESADVLEGLGLARPTVAADLTLSLPPPVIDPVDRIVVCLRPWSGRRHRIPARFRRHAVDDRFVAGAARSLDELSTATGLPIHLVAFDSPKDDPLHQQVAARMTHTPTLSCPSLHEVLDEVAASRLVVSMRYHGGMAAVLAGRPAVLVGYSAKVDSLAADIGIRRGRAALRRQRPRRPGRRRGIGHRPGRRRGRRPGTPRRAGAGQRLGAGSAGRAGQAPGLSRLSALRRRGGRR